MSVLKVWENIPVRPDNFPSVAFSSILDEVIGFVGIPEKKTDRKMAEFDTKDLALPESPLQMIRQSEKHPLVQAFYMQLLGLITPSYCSLETQRDFFTRSLSLLWQTDDSSPDVKLLKARAYLYLDQRPKAVKLLGTPGTPEGKAFKEFLNANLPDQETFIRQIKSPIKKLMAQLEQYHLTEAYTTARKPPEINKIVGSVPESWKFLIAQKLLDHDGWSNQSNIPLKAFLEKEFPVGGITMETLYKSALASGELEQKRMEFEMLFVDHIWQALRSDSTRLFSQSGQDGLSDYDYLLLLQAIGEATLLKYAEFYQYIQGKPETALQLINAFLTVFQGHPAFHIRKASIIQHLYKQSKSLTDLNKSDLVNKIMQDGFKGLWWIGQDDPRLSTYHISQLLNDYEHRINGGKIPYIKETVPGKPIYTHFRREYPPNSFIRLIHIGFTLEQKLEFIHYNIHDISLLVNKKSIQKEYSEKKIVNIKNRFSGNPNWIPLKAKLCKLSGQYEALKDIYKKGIDETPLFWANYEALGLEYLRSGDYEQANAIFMEYPPFTDKEGGYHRVSLSNTSYMAGCHFFWRGDHHSAKTFYQIAADLDTGSEGSLTSKVRLNLINRDLNTAAVYSMRRAKRYNSKYAYRDYMSLLHVLGQSEIAWPIFDSLIGRFDTPQIWTSALIGHRINSTSKEDLKTWINHKSDLVNGKTNYPARFALLSLIDRKPDLSDAEFIKDIELNKIVLPPKAEDGEMKEKIETLGYTDTSFIPAQKMNDAIATAGPPNRYHTIALSYLYLKQQSYDKAFDALKRLSLYLNLKTPAGRQILPYAVFAVIKSGNDHLLERLISQDFINFRDYDMTLAKAVQVGLQQDHDESLALFNKAFNNRPHTENRLFFPWYQIVELLEWLYIETGEKQYLDQALTWARSHQVVQPMFAWAFAFEAKYTTDPPKKMRALAYAQYLDKDSAWISHFSNEVKTKAAVWFESHNPFTPEGQPVIKNQQAI